VRQLYDDVPGCALRGQGQSTVLAKRGKLELYAGKRESQSWQSSIGLQRRRWGRYINTAAAAVVTDDDRAGKIGTQPPDDIELAHAPCRHLRLDEAAQGSFRELISEPWRQLAEAVQLVPPFAQPGCREIFVAWHMPANAQYWPRRTKIDVALVDDELDVGRGIADENANADRRMPDTAKVYGKFLGAIRHLLLRWDRE